METKLKMEKIQDIKKVTAQISAIKSEMSRNEDILKDLERYKEFLDSLIPVDQRGDLSVTLFFHSSKRYLLLKVNQIKKCTLRIHSNY
jgi:hypothetical protein